MAHEHTHVVLSQSPPSISLGMPRCGDCVSFGRLEDESIYGPEVGLCDLAYGHAVANIDSVGFQVVHASTPAPNWPGDGRECRIGLLVRRDFGCVRFQAIENAGS